MGYQTTWGGSFVFSLLNIRLGWWLGNPGNEGETTFQREPPPVAMLPLLQETLRVTTDDRKYVYLSDGGHFENLGVYEMVRRRCRQILVIDAGRDPKFTLEDLGNAVRKIAIDLRIPIHFYKLEMLKPRPSGGSDLGPRAPYHAVAEIDYCALDGSSQKGILLYIKPSYHGRESASVRSYAAENVQFPHESTSNQWFREAQFES
jgi:hypothetical protein